MGAQATLFSSSYRNASNYNITAAVMHHTYSHSFPPPQIPFLAFTGAKDTTASAASTQKFFNAAGAYPARGYINRADADHMEPYEGSTYNPLLAQFTAAWFKVHLDKTPTMRAIVQVGVNGTKHEQEVNFDEMLFGTGKQSLCGDGDGSVVQCELHR
jgi:hypothetical protein